MNYRSGTRIGIQGRKVWTDSSLLMMPELNSSIYILYSLFRLYRLQGLASGNCAEGEQELQPCHWHPQQDFLPRQPARHRLRVVRHQRRDTNLIHPRFGMGLPPCLRFTGIVGCRGQRVSLLCRRACHRNQELCVASHWKSLWSIWNEIKRQSLP